MNVLRVLIAVTSAAVLHSGGGPLHAQAGQTREVVLDSVLTLLHEQELFSGIVLISENGRVAFDRSYGAAPDGSRVTSRTPLPIASITKTFTAAAVMLLAAEGRLSYDDAITAHLPELPYTGVTIRQLLNHTSGVHFLSLINAQWDTTRVLRNADVLTLVAVHRPGTSWEPGTRWGYSNDGYVLLASLIERLSGQSYSAYLQQRLFEPLGMENARVEASGPDLTRGWLQWHGAGEIIASADDLLRWDQALRSGRLFTSEQLEEAYARPLLSDGSHGETGFGWMVAGDSGGRVFHAGEDAVVKSGIQRYLDDNHALIILQTEHGITFYDVFGMVTKIWHGEPYELPARRMMADVDPAIYERYVGVYDAPFGRIHITVDEGRLFLEPEGAGGKEELLPSSPTIFFFGQQDLTWEFFLNEEGTVIGFGFAGRPETMGRKIR